MTKEQLKERTKQFALRVMSLVDHLLKTTKAEFMEISYCEAPHPSRQTIARPVALARQPNLLQS